MFEHTYVTLYTPNVSTDCIAEKGLPNGMTISSDNLKILFIMFQHGFQTGKLCLTSLTGWT